RSRGQTPAGHHPALQRRHRPAVNATASPQPSYFRAAALGPFAILATAAAWLAAHWPQIPPRFPVHWNAAGAANGWAARSFWGVYGLLCLAAVVCAVLLLFAYATWHWSKSPHARSSPQQRRATAFTCLATAYLLALVFGFAALMPLLRRPERLVLPVVIAVPLVVAILLLIAWRVHPAGDEHRRRDHDNHWVAGLFYYNPYDPAVMVPKRFGLGYTFNFANRRAWWMLGLLAAAIFVMVTFSPP
ncbi:MAG TPA: DUF5808 domain-containing protein, partial [Terriglobales bacterium]|nr:DUF5808 domain-containing protein [Terriglobales bacterium]